MKNILLVGSNSAVGIDFIKESNKIYNITTMSRSNADIIFDLKDDINEIKPLKNIDTIIHMAAIVKSENELDFVDVNVKGTLKICMLAKKNNIKNIVLISSIYATYEENNKFFSYYSLTKKHSEHLAKLYCKQNHINLSLIRPSPIYGNNELFAMNQPLLYNFIKKSKNNEDITIYGSNDALRNYIHVNDLIFAINYVIENSIFGEFEVVNNKNYKLSEIASIIIETYNSKSQIKFKVDEDDILDNLIFAGNDLFTNINDKAYIGIEEGMNLLKGDN